MNGMEKFDYKKAYREFYLPPKAPGIVSVPEMRFVAVRGKGDPNAEDGAYQAAVRVLYGIAFTIKMSKLGGRRIEGYFEYIVPPLEGLWQQPGVQGVDYAQKAKWEWISLIRLPDFVQKEDFEWAVQEATEKKKADFSSAEFFTYDEGLCVQCMHIGPYDDEPATLRKMEAYAAENGYAPDFSAGRCHHEIYLSDPRRCRPERCKTVIRYPVRRVQQL